MVTLLKKKVLIKNEIVITNGLYFGVAVLMDSISFWLLQKLFSIKLCSSILSFYRVSWSSGYEHQTQTLVLLFSRVWVRVLVVTLLSLSKTLDYMYLLLSTQG